MSRLCFLDVEFSLDDGVAAFRPIVGFVQLPDRFLSSVEWMFLHKGQSAQTPHRISLSLLWVVRPLMVLGLHRWGLYCFHRLRSSVPGHA